MPTLSHSHVGLPVGLPGWGKPIAAPLAITPELQVEVLRQIAAADQVMAERDAALDRLASLWLWALDCERMGRLVTPLALISRLEDDV